VSAVRQDWMPAGHAVDSGRFGGRRPGLESGPVTPSGIERTSSPVSRAGNGRTLANSVYVLRPKRSAPGQVALDHLHPNGRKASERVEVKLEVEGPDQATVRAAAGASARTWPKPATAASTRSTSPSWTRHPRRRHAHLRLSSRPCTSRNASAPPLSRQELPPPQGCRPGGSPDPHDGSSAAGAGR